MQRTFKFQMTIDVGKEPIQRVMDKLYLACKDAMVCHNGVELYLDFEREADSLQEAVETAKWDLKSVGYTVLQWTM